MSEKQNVSTILASGAIKQLSMNMQLTPEQIQKASSSALQLSTNDKLRSCDAFSIVKYCFETSRYNFVRDDAIYPVPYSNSIQAQVGYKGFIEIALRSGKYSKINASVVHKCDKVAVDEETGEINVKFNKDFLLRKDDEVMGYYAYAKDKNYKICDSYYMTKNEVENHRAKYSKAGPIWRDSFDKMALKTVIKQLCKTIDQTPMLKDVIELDQKVFNHGLKDGEYLDNPSNQNSNFVNNTILENNGDLQGILEKSEEIIEGETVDGDTKNV